MCLACTLAPPAGPALSFLLWSLLYALNCFEYKWSLHGVPLHVRISMVEEGWAFFAGGPTKPVHNAVHQ